MEIREVLALNLRTYRQAQELSQEELAHRADIDRTYISALERCVYAASIDVVDRLARVLGYRTIVADGRAAFLTRERFPEADELILAWPKEAFERIALDSSCYVCILSHDPKFDEPALTAALRSPARYIGAIGSRKTQAARRAWLESQGFSETDIARVHGPIGLDLGGRQPAETALAILAQMTAVRYGVGDRAR